MSQKDNAEKGNQTKDSEQECNENPETKSDIDEVYKDFINDICAKDSTVGRYCTKPKYKDLDLHCLINQFYQSKIGSSSMNADDFIEF